MPAECGGTPDNTGGLLAFLASHALEMAKLDAYENTPVTQKLTILVVKQPNGLVEVHIHTDQGTCEGIVFNVKDVEMIQGVE